MADTKSHRLYCLPKLPVVDGVYVCNGDLFVWPFQYVAYVHAGGHGHREPVVGGVQSGPYGGYQYPESCSVMGDGVFELSMCPSFVSTDAPVSTAESVFGIGTVCEEMEDAVSSCRVF